MKNVQIPYDLFVALVEYHLSLIHIFPRIDPFFDAVAEIVPLQLLAYYAAREKGCDIDKPKNLAKSVTVE